MTAMKKLIKKSVKFFALFLSMFLFSAVSKSDIVQNFVEVYPFSADLIDSLLNNEADDGLGFLYFFTFIYLIYWCLRGAWRFLFHPPSEDSWRFREEDDPWLYFWSDHVPGYGSSIAIRADWLKRKISNSDSKRKIKKWQKELDNLDSKYSLQAELNELDWGRKTRKEISNKQLEEFKFGSLASKIVCPHCNEKGKVWRKENATATEMTRETGIGAVIGKKTVTNKEITKLHCKNCGTTWSI